MDSHVLVEGRVSRKVVSFLEPGSFLFVGLVCKGWKRHFRKSKTDFCTRDEFAFTSRSRLLESLDNGLSTVFPYLRAIKYNAELPVFQALVDSGHTWNSTEVGYAAQMNRVDVLEFFFHHGQRFDERVLHSAARRGCKQAIEFLLEKGCPIDTVPIDWGYGEKVSRDLHDRSLEVSIRSKNKQVIDLLSSRGSRGIPLTHETLKVSLGIEGGEKIVDDLIMSGCPVRNGTFEDSVLEGDILSVDYMLRNKILMDEWGLHGTTRKARPDLFKMILNQGIHPIDEDVDNCILGHDLEGAVELTREYDCFPTIDACEEFIRDGCKGTSVAEYARIEKWIITECGYDLNFES